MREKRDKEIQRNGEVKRKREGDRDIKGRSYRMQENKYSERI